MPELKGLIRVLEGTTAIAYNKEDYVSAAKILSKYAEDHKNFTIKAGFIDGSVVDVNAVKELGKPTFQRSFGCKSIGWLKRTYFRLCYCA